MTVVGALALYAWDSGRIQHKDRFLPRRFSRVEAHLFRSGQIHRRLVANVLREHEVDLVIDLQDASAGEHKSAEAAAVRELGLEYQRFPLRGDGTGDLDQYADAVTILAHSLDAGETVLVHCAAGAVRTGIVIAAFELLVRGDAEKANQELARYEDEPSALAAFINANRFALARELVERGVLEAVPEKVPELEITS
jgi:protein tyrosine/serine phosphatase